MSETTPPDAIAKVIESAARLGVEIDAGEARKWIESMATEVAGGDVVVDVDSGVFGHRASMLDLDQHDLERFKKVAKIVGFENRPGVQTALALSGSSAPSPPPPPSPPTPTSSSASTSARRPRKTHAASWPRSSARRRCRP